MPKIKLGAFLESFAKKGKIELSPEFKATLDAVKDVEVDSKDTDLIEAAFMTEEVAKQKLGNTIKYEALAGIDTKIHTIIDTLPLDDAAKADIRKTSNSYDKAEKTINYVNELAKKSKPAGDNAEQIESYRKQLADSKEQLRQLTEGHAVELKKRDDANEADAIDNYLVSKLGVKSYALPKSLSPERKAQMVRLLVDDKMTQLGIKFSRNADKVIKIVNKDGTDAFDKKNNPYEIDSFLDGTLAEADVLANSDDQSYNDRNHVIKPDGKTVRQPSAVSFDVRQQLEEAVKRSS